MTMKPKLNDSAPCLSVAVSFLIFNHGSFSQHICHIWSSGFIRIKQKIFSLTFEASRSAKMI